MFRVYHHNNGAHGQTRVVSRHDNRSEAIEKCAELNMEEQAANRGSGHYFSTDADEFEFDGHTFRLNAMDAARLVDDGDGNAHWEVETIGGGSYETTDDGLRMMREASRQNW